MNPTFRSLILTYTVSVFTFGLPAQSIPHIVTKAPSDAYIGLCKMSDGEIRHYNYGNRRKRAVFIFQAKTMD